MVISTQEIQALQAKGGKKEEYVLFILEKPIGGGSEREGKKRSKEKHKQVTMVKMLGEKSGGGGTGIASVKVIGSSFH